MQITILPPDHDNAQVRASSLAREPQQEYTSNAQGRFECPDIECGAVFSYRRVSCGHFVPPNFCPMCGGPMEAEEQGHGKALITEISDYSSQELSDWRQLGGQQLPQLPG